MKNIMPVSTTLRPVTAPLFTYSFAPPFLVVCLCPSTSFLWPSALFRSKHSSSPFPHNQHPFPIMATHVVTAVTPTPSVPNQISVHGQPSPSNSAVTTPSNNSPTSPNLTTASLHQLPLQSRQLRPPKGPLYVPAALRPTERPQKSSPITPPRSVHGSLDSLEESAEPITRRSTMESKSSGISKVAEHEWLKNESLGEVTGLPTRDHWKVSSEFRILSQSLYTRGRPRMAHGAREMSFASSSSFRNGVLAFDK